MPSDVDAEFTFDAFAHNVELRFTETADKHVAGFNVLFDLERCVFFLHLDEPLNCFFFVFESLDCVRDDGFREFDFFKLNLIVGSCKRVVGVGVNEFCNCADVACVQAIDGFLFFAFENVKRTDFFGFVNADVVHGVAA